MIIPTDTSTKPPKDNTSATVTTHTPIATTTLDSMITTDMTNTDIHRNTSIKDSDTTTEDKNTTNDPHRLNTFRHFEMFFMALILLSLTNRYVFNYVETAFYILDMTSILTQWPAMQIELSDL